MEILLKLVVAGWALTTAMLALLVVAPGQGAPQPQPLRIRGLQITDAQGKPRIEFGLLPDATFGVALYDDLHVSRLKLDVHSNGRSGIGFRDAGGKVRMWLTLDPDGSPHLYMWDAKGRLLSKAP
jgi:hypothetical protein